MIESLIAQTGQTVFIGGVSLFVLSIIKLVHIYRSKRPGQTRIFTIWLFGLIIFLSGFLMQLIEINKVFDQIAEMNNIYPAMFAQSISAAYNPIISGLVVFIGSLIIWGCLRILKENRQRTVDGNQTYIDN